jgi:L-threonylcarbamoyladenylate synthase
MNNMKALSTFLVSAAVIMFGISQFFIFAGLDSVPNSGSFALLDHTYIALFLSVIFFIFWLAVTKTGRRRGKRVEDLSDVLTEGGVAVIPTDTTYGIVGSALNEKTVNEIYRLRKRDLDKPFIVLISDRKDLEKFGVKTTPAQEKILEKVWPGSVSIILVCPNDKFSYLHRGKKTLAFRLPAKEDLRELIKKVGPLVAPSANPQGLPVAKNIPEARAYFGHHIDYYQDGGEVTASPSKLIDITDGTEKVLR